MVKNRDIVSIIVPVYNVEQYIEKCLNSLIHQTYDNIEIIVVDDKTPDDSMSIVDRMAKQDSRIRTIYHPINKGLGAARNTGVKAAKGKYIMFLDSDDQFTLDAVEVLLSTAQSTSADMVLGRMGWLKEGRISPVEYIEEKINYYELYHQDNLRDVPVNYIYIGQACNRIYKKAMLEENNIWFPEGIYWEDVSFSIDCWLASKKICFIQDYVYLRLERNDENNLSITQDYNMKKYLDRNIVESSVSEILCHHVQNGHIDKKSALNIQERVFKTTKSILKHRNDNLEVWLDTWFLEYSKFHDGLIEKIRHL